MLTVKISSIPFGHDKRQIRIKHHARTLSPRLRILVWGIVNVNLQASLAQKVRRLLAVKLAESRGIGVSIKDPRVRGYQKERTHRPIRRGTRIAGVVNMSSSVSLRASTASLPRSRTSAR
jgi:hypothetical protein